MKKKILLYLGNHNNDRGVQDYIETFKRMSKKYDIQLIISHNLSLANQQKFNSIIIIEEFVSFREYYLVKNFLKNYKGKKILVVTEFINKKNITFNTFEKSNSNLINFLLPHKFMQNLFIFFGLTFFRNIFDIFLNLFRLIIFPLRFIFFIFKVISQIILEIFEIIFKTNIFILLLVKNILDNFTNVRFSIYNDFLSKFLRKKKSEKNKVDNYDFNFSKKISNFIENIREEMYMKYRFLTFKNMYNCFDVLLKSHDEINLNEYNKENYRLFFYSKNKIKIYKDIKLKLSFSGVLNNYRRGILIKLCRKKNNFFDYSEIENILREKNTFIRKEKDINICSIHIQKSKNWKFSSPTRYLNSISKNEIPLIITDKFKDIESNYLTVKNNFLKISNFKKLSHEIRKLNENIEKFSNIVSKKEKMIIKKIL